MHIQTKGIEIELSKIDTSPFFFRSMPSEEDLEELQDSLDRVGQVHAISVIEGENGRYESINGLRRRMAATALGWKKIRVDIWDFDQAELSEEGGREKAVRAFLAAANIQEPLTALERAEQYREVMTGLGLGAAELAGLFNRPEPQVRRDLKYLDIDPEVRSELLKPEVAELVKPEHLDTLAEFANPKKRGWRLDTEGQKRAIQLLMDQKDKRAIDDPKRFARGITAMKKEDRDEKTRARAARNGPAPSADAWVRTVFKAVDGVEKAVRQLYDIQPSGDFRMEWVDHQALSTRLTTVARGLVDYPRRVPAVGDLAEIAKS